MSAIFRFDHVAKWFGNEPALIDFSLDGFKGTVTALLGDSGAGKTTALQILLGLVEPEVGAAQVFGLDSQSNSLEIRRRVGYVAERPALYDWMTVAETGWFAAGFYPAGFLPTFRRLTRRLGLMEDKRVDSLSKGMRAKLSLALALAHRPELLILDEPTSGLDFAVRREFLENIVDTTARGGTVFLVSHQIAEVERVADVVGLVRNGRLIAVDKLDALKTRICELTITFAAAPFDLPPIPGDVIRAERRNRQWRVLVRDLYKSRLATFGERSNVSRLHMRKPSFEELVVGLMQGECRTGRTEFKANRTGMMT